MYLKSVSEALDASDVEGSFVFSLFEIPQGFLRTEEKLGFGISDPSHGFQGKGVGIRSVNERIVSENVCPIFS